MDKDNILAIDKHVMDAQQARITELEAQLAEAKQRADAADEARGKLRLELWQAEDDSKRYRVVLAKVEAYMAGESGPLCRLWENCDIGDYDDNQTDWEQTLFDLRDWKNGCVPAASLGGGTEWPEVLLYREILAALSPDARESALRSPVIVKTLTNQHGQAFAVYLSDGKKINIQRKGEAAWLRIEDTPIVQAALGQNEICARGDQHCSRPRQSESEETK
jgi:hypothetical protein